MTNDRYLVRSARQRWALTADVYRDGKYVDTPSLNRLQAYTMTALLRFDRDQTYHLYFSYEAPDDIERSQKDVSYFQFPILGACPKLGITCVDSTTLTQSLINPHCRPLSRELMQACVLHLCRSGLLILGCPITDAIAETVEKAEPATPNGLRPESAMTNLEWDALVAAGMEGLWKRPSLWVRAVLVNG